MRTSQVGAEDGMNWRSHLSSTKPKGRCTVAHTGKWPGPVNSGADGDPLVIRPYR
jgi:hypothetical protein